jgi:hypothetical protein
MRSLSARLASDTAPLIASAPVAAGVEELVPQHVGVGADVVGRLARQRHHDRRSTLVRQGGAPRRSAGRGKPRRSARSDPRRRSGAAAASEERKAVPRRLRCSDGRPGRASGCRSRRGGPQAVDLAGEVMCRAVGLLGDEQGRAPGRRGRSHPRRRPWPRWSRARLVAHRELPHRLVGDAVAVEVDQPVLARAVADDADRSGGQRDRSSRTRDVVQPVVAVGAHELDVAEGVERVARRQVVGDGARERHAEAHGVVDVLDVDHHRVEGRRCAR